MHPHSPTMPSFRSNDLVGPTSGAFCSFGLHGGRTAFSQICRKPGGQLFEPGGALAGILSRWTMSCQTDWASLLVAAGCACCRALACRLSLESRTIAVQAACCTPG